MEKVGNRLLLSGTSIGNHQNISFTDTLTIEKLTQDSLILKRGELLLKYARNNEVLNQKQYLPRCLPLPRNFCQ